MKEDIEFLKKLQHTLQNQDTDVQASPRFWVLMDYRTVPTGDEYAESHEVYDRDAAEGYAIDTLVDDITDDINAAIEQDEPDAIEGESTTRVIRCLSIQHHRSITTIRQGGIYQ